MRYKFHGHEVVLDIGCGHGRLTQEIAELIPQDNIIGIDNSDDMISYAKKYNNKKNIVYQLIDVNEINFDQRFDVIISTFCLQWVKNKKSVFEKIRNYLKEDGQVLLIMPFRNEEIATIRNDLMQQNHWGEYFKSFTDPTELLLDNCYDIYAEQAKLKNIKYELEVVTTTFVNESGLISFLKSISPYLSQLPNESLQNLFMCELVQRYLRNYPPAPDKSCKIDYTYASLLANGFQ